MITVTSVGFEPKRANKATENQSPLTRQLLSWFAAVAGLMGCSRFLLPPHKSSHFVSFTEHPHKLYHISPPQITFYTPTDSCQDPSFYHVISLFVGVCITTISSPDSTKGLKYLWPFKMSPLSSVTYIIHHSSTPG